MRALKALVYGMGVVILIGTSVLATLIVERGSRLAGSGVGSGTAGPAGPHVRTLAVPAGGEVIETRLDGGRILMRVRFAAGREALFLFDGADGRPLGRYDIVVGEAR